VISFFKFVEAHRLYFLNGWDFDFGALSDGAGIGIDFVHFHKFLNCIRVQLWAIDDILEICRFQVMFRFIGTCLSFLDLHVAFVFNHDFFVVLGAVLDFR
jgi:hypothetical protein